MDKQYVNIRTYLADRIAYTCIQTKRFLSAVLTPQAAALPLVRRCSFRNGFIGLNNTQIGTQIGS